MDDAAIAKQQVMGQARRIVGKGVDSGGVIFLW